MGHNSISFDLSGISRRSLLRGVSLGAGMAALGPLLTGCSGGDSGASATIGKDIDEIARLAAEEKFVQLIAYPATWANYAGHFEAFNAKYGVDTPVDSPDASSAEELEAVRNLKGQPSQPDVLDLGYSFTKPAMEAGLIEPYKPTNYEAIPDALKDPEGYWVGAYYGVLSIGVNTAEADTPGSFEDLKDPKYRGKVALPGDPRQGASAIASVAAAALSNGGSLDDIAPGVDYFAELAEMGNLVSVSDPVAAMTTGQASVIFDWNYNWLGSRQQLERDGVSLEEVVPEDGVYGNYYAQPVTAGAARPNAGRLWVDWLTSDEGSEQYARGGAVPARFEELTQAGKLSDEALAALPAPDVVARVAFPNLEQGEAANEVIATQWAQKVRV